MRSRLAALLAAAIAGAAAPALAAAPAPRNPVDIDRFMGRWFEILHTPNILQKNCHAPVQVWVQTAPGRFAIDQVCHRGSPSGAARHVQTAARSLDAPANTKFEASFFGGLLHRDYWVLDHADTYDWMIASTSDGKFIGVLARQPTLPSREVEVLRSKVAAMGLDAAGLVAANARAD